MLKYARPVPKCDQIWFRFWWLIEQLSKLKIKFKCKFASVVQFFAWILFRFRTLFGLFRYFVKCTSPLLCCITKFRCNSIFSIPGCYFQYCYYCYISHIGYPLICYWLGKIVELISTISLKYFAIFINLSFTYLGVIPHQGFSALFYSSQNIHSLDGISLSILLKDNFIASLYLICFLSN